ncbi:zinc transporter ZIP1-like isoform X1 [Megachile rotundata]|uniref:zinc transporter ZIP1-like isoform X1 n=1 Tax=Megachile rotundata TaxID=143995 RepID=UPI003FD03AA6
MQSTISVLLVAYLQSYIRNIRYPGISTALRSTTLTSRPSIIVAMSPSEDNFLMERLITSAHFHDEEEHHDEEQEMHDVLVAKGVTMVILCVVSTCMGIIPMQVAKCLKWKTSGVGNPRSTMVVSLLLGFGGGVLFCTTFLHLLPEVKEGVQHLIEEQKLPQLSFSLAETLTCAGFFLMYLVEESVHSHLRKKENQKDEYSKKDVSRSTNELVENGQTLPNCGNGHSHYSGHGHSHHLPVIMDEKDDFVISSLRGLLIILGLSVHELFEGLAIGLESSASYVWYMFAAVAAHKFVIAFCIGVELLALNTRTYLSVIYVCTFAVVSPLGIGIGMLLVGGESAAANGILPVLLQGLASGTLLYVVFFEILQEHRTGLKQYLSILVGFIVMFGLQLVRPVHLVAAVLRRRGPPVHHVPALSSGSPRQRRETSAQRSASDFRHAKFVRVAVLRRILPRVPR